MKAIPPALRNACDYVLQFNFIIAHIAGSNNTSVDFLTRLELKVTKEKRLKISEHIQTTPIQVTTFSSDVSDEKYFFFTQTDNDSESEKQTIQQKDQSRQSAKERLAEMEPFQSTTSVKELTTFDGNATSCSTNSIKANAVIRVEQEVDLVLKNLNLKTLSQPYDEVLLTTDRR